MAAIGYGYGSGYGYGYGDGSGDGIPSLELSRANEPCSQPTHQ